MEKFLRNEFCHFEIQIPDTQYDAKHITCTVIYVYGINERLGG